MIQFAIDGNLGHLHLLFTGSAKLLGSKCAFWRYMSSSMFVYGHWHCPPVTIWSLLLLLLLLLLL
jgi:hypothetical protein